MDPSSDTVFYSQPRFVTHIDDNAIVSLKQYYDAFLPGGTGAAKPSEGSLDTSTPRPARILDVCSSWVSHYPPRIVKAAATTSIASLSRSSSAYPETDPTTPSTAEANANIECYGTGMNAAELGANPVLNPTASGRARDGEPVAERRWWLQDLNTEPVLRLPDQLKSKFSSGSDTTAQVFDATTLVVSIDYLTSPLEVLRSILAHTVPGGSIHLAISNRCFPTKAVRRWLEVSEEERLEMVGDYLWWSGWREVEIVEVVPKSGGWADWKDPLWVVRARKMAEGVESSNG